MTEIPRNAVGIVCTDRRRSLDFYCQAFEAKVLPGDGPVTCPWLQLGDLTVTLVENTDSESPLDYAEHAMATLFLQVDDLDAAYVRATRYGARVIEPPDEEGTIFIVADPDGIMIEVMRYDPE